VAPTVVRSIRLFFQEGSSDKVYCAAIVEEDGRFTVQVEWGRRNTILNRGAKAVKVSRADADLAYERLVREKTKKGYQEVTGDVAPAAVAPPVGEGSGTRAGVGRRARLTQAAQLLNAVDDGALEELLADPEMLAQQKLDGVRVLVHVGESVVATNRSGEIIAFAAELEGALAGAAGAVLDGEVVPGARGPDYWLFDLLEVSGADLRPTGYRDRYRALADLARGLPEPVRLVPLAESEPDKRRLLETLRGQNAEGIVFKRADAPYRAGRPASGGAQLKYKFIKSADVFLTSNAGNAYQMAVMDGGRCFEVGKVFAGTTNQTRSEIDARLAEGDQPVAEVRYLYATDGDILYQPVFVRLRDDKTPADCHRSQLIRTNRAVAAEPRRERPWIPRLPANR
jgi:bifunctional non-homologous end joining protein LigD